MDGLPRFVDGLVGFQKGEEVLFYLNRSRILKTGGLYPDFVIAVSDIGNVHLYYPFAGDVPFNLKNFPAFVQQSDLNIPRSRFIAVEKSQGKLFRLAAVQHLRYHCQVTLSRKNRAATGYHGDQKHQD